MSAKLIKSCDVKAVSFAALMLPTSGEPDAASSSEADTAKLVSAPLPTAKQFHRDSSIETEQPEPLHARNIEQEASALLEAARAEAEALVANAQLAANQIAHEARERGLAEAQNIFESEINAAVQPLRERLSRTIDEVNALRHHVMASAERDLVRLAIEVARKIVLREVTIDPEIALTLARVALSRLQNTGNSSVARIHLNPEDLAFVEANRARLDSAITVELVEDRGIGRGGCLIHTEMGDIDARIEQQFAEVGRGFLKG